MVGRTSEFSVFGLGLSAAAWCVGVASKRTGWVLCNPLLIAGLLIIALLAVFDIPLEKYNIGGDLIKLMLGPVTAVLALNIYRQREILREHFLPCAGRLSGGKCGQPAQRAGPVPGVPNGGPADRLPAAQSVTTAIAVGIAESRGGVQGIAAAAVAVAGITGAVCAPLFAKWFHITDPVAEGLAIGACSHALGTTKALEIGELQGAMSSIAICVCGIFTSLIALFL